MDIDIGKFVENLFKVGIVIGTVYVLDKVLSRLGNNLTYDNLGQIPQFDWNSLPKPPVNPTEPGISNLISDLNNVLGKPLERSWPTTNVLVSGHNVLNLLEPQPGRLSPVTEIAEIQKWLRLLAHPSVVIILGRRGSGKSALGYRLLELLRWIANCYVVGLPKDARKLLPDWIGMATCLEDVPPRSIVLVDEAYIPYHARCSMAFSG